MVILRALPGLGDLLCVTPTLRALRAHRRDLEVTYIGLPETRDLVARYPHLIDRFVEFPGFPGLPERRPDVARIPGFLAAAQAEHYDLAIQLHGSGIISNVVVELLGAASMAGHAASGGTMPERGTFLPWVEASSEVRRGLRLLGRLGWPSDDERLEFPIDPKAEAPVLPEPYVVVHPGASAASKRWAAAGFCAVAQRLQADGFTVVLTGSEIDAARNRAIGAALPVPPVDLTGRTTLDELALALRGARLLVANDTGVSHLAAALGVASVIVFTSTEPARWAPLDASRHAVARGSVRSVLASVRGLLEGEASHAA